MAVDETGMGNYEDKLKKKLGKSRIIWNSLKSKKSVGILEYDEKTKTWCANVKNLPGAYAQADTVEEVREQLAEVIEDYILVSLQERHPLPGFKKLKENCPTA